MTSDPLAPHALLLGCGYCGLALAERLSAQGVRVWGTARDTSTRGAALEAAGAQPLQWRLEEAPPQLPEALTQAPIDLVFLAPTATDAQGDHLAPFLAALDALEGLPIRAGVYLSSTSVYGDAAGGIVDAHTAPAPLTVRGQRRLDLERLFLARGASAGWRGTTARLPGIYGPGRTLLGRLRAGTYTLVDGGARWGARIHRDDVAMGVEALLRGGRAGTAYILCDDTPFRVKDLVAWACERLELPLPPTRDLEDYAAEHPFAASFWRTSNRYSNRAIASIPGFSLAYPSFREGLSALL